MEVPVSLPLDEDGFLRRECPTCEREFKWFHHQEGDSDAEVVSQYYCPLCGVASGLNTWFTSMQLAYMKGQASPAIDQLIRDELASAFKGNKFLKFSANKSFTLGLDVPPTPEEPNDMVIVESPCHPNEPLKIPESATDLVYCLICGSKFAT